MRGAYLVLLWAGCSFDGSGLTPDSSVPIDGPTDIDAVAEACLTNTSYVPAANGVRYRRLAAEQDWHASQGACASDGAHLVHVNSQGENDIVMSYLTSGGDSVWIGLSDTALEQTFVFTDGSAPTYTQWQESPEDKDKDCVRVRDFETGEWRDESCSQARSALCECPTTQPAAPACVNDARYENHGPYRYSLREQYIDWQAAKAVCESEGAHLVAIGSRSENDVVEAVADEAGVPFVWLGYSDLAAEGAFAWSHGVQTAYTRFENNQPDDAGNNEDCVELRGGGRWNDGVCTDGKPYICECSVY